ncbi:MAG: hypothetical protein OEM02_02325 [Desulfobulbaceae bacterium]|nr:hypothetical protein [Desulfobulbaceae bacterium]
MAQDFLDARKERFGSEDVWELLKLADSIITVKGKKVSTWDPKTADKKSVLKQVMGPSGNLRAPTLCLGSIFVVGFHLEMYEHYLLTI